ncbi:MAG: NfeD family protein [Acidobacteria bacterium]|nr:NfeD family protein [Acidobacteriota bacterium]MBK8150873.1 NfeD family protein [Acidobacteriota bacterium]MBK8812188.1 NfeD family protein [Acidobacteriota bacterium]
MEQLAWIFWLVLGIGLIIAEIFTFGFVLFWFGIGAIAAAALGFLGFGLGVQFLVFAGVSMVLTVMSRTIFVRYLSHGDENDMKMGMDSLPGQVGTVLSESKGALNEGAVKVFGSTWTAYPEDDSKPLIEGEKVEVVRVQGNSIWVRPVNTSRELPEWRKGKESSGG